MRISNFFELMHVNNEKYASFKSILHRKPFFSRRYFKQCKPISKCLYGISLLSVFKFIHGRISPSFFFDQENISRELTWFMIFRLFNQLNAIFYWHRHSIIWSIFYFLQLLPQPRKDPIKFKIFCCNFSMVMSWFKTCALFPIMDYKIVPEADLGPDYHHCGCYWHLNCYSRCR